MEITHDVEYSWEEYSRGLLSASLTLSSTLISNIHIERILLKIFHLFAFIIILSHWQRMPSSTASRQHLLYVFTLICVSSTHATHVSLFLCLCVCESVCFAVSVGFRFVFYSKFGSTICPVVALRTFTIVILISTLHHRCCLCLTAG